MTRGRGTGSFWTTSYGGAPVWAIAATTVVALGAIGAYVTYVNAPEPRYEATTAAPTPSATAFIELPPAGSEVMFFGDSWVAGEVADEGASFTEVLSKQMGWVPLVEGFPGSGFTRAARETQGLLTEHANDLDASLTPELVIVNGGVNDAEDAVNLGAVRTAVNEVVSTIEGKYPDAKLVVLGPFNRSWPLHDGLYDVSLQMRAVAQEHGLPFINPVSKADTWINKSNVDTMIAQGRGHPGNEGHAFIAGRLGEALTRLVPAS